MSEEPFMNEFRPPDDSMIQYMLDTSSFLFMLAKRKELSESDRQALGRASHSLKVMLAMAIGGHFLYETEAKFADELHQVASRLFDKLMLLDPQSTESVDTGPLLRFASYREDGVNVDDLGRFNQGFD